MKNKLFSRRNFIQQSGKAGVGIGLVASLPSLFFSSPASAGVYGATSYTQQPLPYQYNALEPFIDAQTMEIHYSKHAAGYAKNLAEAVLAEGVDPNKTTLEELMANISKYSTKMRNNAGGHYNHELFWKCMSSDHEKEPGGILQDVILKDFGSYEAFTTQFSDVAKNRFGSGWAWLILDNEKSLKITSTPNQDNPLMKLTSAQSGVADIKGYPLMGLDVWEHAYYLKYQNKRADYISNWWKIVNWKFVNDRYQAAINK